MVSAMKVTPKDNVAVAIEPIAGGQTVFYTLPDGSIHEITAAEDIQIYHKFSTCDINKGEAVLKYGEVIGVATEDIGAGRHVHTHNVISEQEIKEGVHTK